MRAIFVIALLLTAMPAGSATKHASKKRAAASAADDFAGYAHSQRGMGSGLYIFQSVRIATLDAPLSAAVRTTHYTGNIRGRRPSQPVSLSDARVVRGRVHGADAAAGAGLAGDRARRIHADPGADRHRQDAGGFSVVHRPADVLARAGEATGAAASSTFRRSRRWRWTWSAICARRWWGSRRRRSAAGV